MLICRQIPGFRAGSHEFDMQDFLTNQLGENIRSHLRVIERAIMPWDYGII